MASRLFAAMVVLACLIGFTAPALAEDVRVRGYFRQDGTYVQPHMRSAPDNSHNNNWSTAPNINPYTGQPGTNQPRLLDPNPGFGLSGSGNNGFGLSGNQRGRGLGQ